MKKIILIMSILAVSAVGAFAQEMVNFHIIVDDASHLRAVESYYDPTTYSPVEIQLPLSSGDNPLSIEKFHSVMLTANDGYFITGCLQASSGNNNYIFNKTSTQIYVDTPIEGDTYTVTTKSAAESRTASVTVNIDLPENINMTRNQLNGFITFSSPSTVISYDPTDELPLTFSTKDYSPIYNVSVSAGTAEQAYGQWRVTPENGAIINVQVAFPDKNVTYTLESSTGNFDFLTVKAGNPLEIVDISSGSYTVKAGTSVQYNYDTQNYKLESFKINGTPNDNLYSYSFTATDDAIHSFEVKPYEEFNATVHVNFPDHVRVLKGNTYGTEVEFADGVFTVPLKEPYNNQLSVIPGENYFISSVRMEPEDESMNMQKSYFSHNCKGACDIYVELAEVVYDRQTVLFIDNPGILSYFNTSNTFNNKPVFPDPQPGYNIYDVSLACSPALIGGYGDATGAITNVYHNHLAVEKESEWSSSYTVNFQGNDVVHVYVEGRPTVAQLSFDVEDGISAEATHNKLVPVEDFTEPLDLFAGDEVKVKVNAPAGEYVLTLNGEDAPADDDGYHIFNLAGDTTVKIATVDALSDVNPDNHIPAPVYNLQGIPVDRDHLVPGIYVTDGRKFRVTAD